MVTSVGQWEEVRGRGGAAQALSSKPLNTGSGSCHHRAQSSVARAARCGPLSCPGGLAQAHGRTVPSAWPSGCTGLQPWRTAPGCKFLPSSLHTPFSPSAVYKALSQCDLICCSSTPRGRKGRVGGGTGRAALPGLLLGHCILKPTLPICLSLPANSQLLGGSS